MVRLNIESGVEYLEYLNSKGTEEVTQLLSLITTHHTFFFREFAQFEFLIQGGLAKIVESARKKGKNKIRVWSAACSRGQEVYSLAMFLDYHLKILAPDFDFEVVGTDVDMESIKIAANGVYPFKELKSIPLNYLGFNWARGTGEISEFSKVKKYLKSKCNFEMYNLVKPGISRYLNEKFDIIFCRNVFIYFNEKQIKECTRGLLEKLNDSGMFFVGISESLAHMGLTIEGIGPSIYCRKGASALQLKVDSARKQETPADLKTQPTQSFEKEIAKNSKKIIRVMCVDDSPSILNIMKKILDNDHGFEVVATALNGEEAKQNLKSTHVDLVTLDIHMPVMDGLSYLKTINKATHPPIVMLSTVNRDNSDLAIKAFELGASDYVEKPTLANLQERGDEIRAKLKTAFYLKSNLNQLSSLDRDFKRTYKVTNPESKVHLAFGALGQKRKVSYLIKNLEKNSPPLIFVSEGMGETLHQIAKEMKLEDPNREIQVGVDKMKPGGVYLCDASTQMKRLSEEIKSKKIASVVCGVASNKVREFIVSVGSQGLVLEDVGSENNEFYGELIELSEHIAPLTSYYSVAEEYLR